MAFVAIFVDENLTDTSF